MLIGACFQNYSSPNSSALMMRLRVLNPSILKVKIKSVTKQKTGTLITIGRENGSSGCLRKTTDERQQTQDERPLSCHWLFYERRKTTDERRQTQDERPFSCHWLFYGRRMTKNERRETTDPRQETLFMEYNPNFEY